MGEQIEAKTYLCSRCQFCMNAEDNVREVQCRAYINPADGQPGVLLNRKSKCSQFKAIEEVA